MKGTDHLLLLGVLVLTLGYVCFSGEVYAEEANLCWSTFLGGSSVDRAESVAVDSSGCLYVTGYTSSSGFPTTSGAFDESFNADYDSFVTKFEADGTDLQYSTLLGGNDLDISGGEGIVLDSAGYVYLTGRTESDDFPTTSGVYDESHNGSADFFIAKLNTNGSNLEYSTFVGTNIADLAWAIDIDGGGNAYVAGRTTASNFPTTSGAYSSSCAGSSDVIVCKLNSDGSTLLYSTYLGGDSYDQVRDIAVDQEEGEAFVTGYTQSTDFPTTSGAYDEDHGGNYDVFLSRFNSTGTQLSYSTFVGGSDWDAAAFVHLDSSGHVYLAGVTSSSNYPTTSGAYDTSHNGSYDVFVTKFRIADSTTHFVLAHRVTALDEPAHDKNQKLPTGGFP